MIVAIAGCPAGLERAASSPPLLDRVLLPDDKGRAGTRGASSALPVRRDTDALTEQLRATWTALRLLAFVLGARHGFDADHFVTIDWLTRCNSRSNPRLGTRPHCRFRSVTAPWRRWSRSRGNAFRWLANAGLAGNYGCDGVHPVPFRARVHQPARRSGRGRRYRRRAPHGFKAKVARGASSPCSAPGLPRRSERSFFALSFSLIFAGSAVRARFHPVRRRD